MKKNTLKMCLMFCLLASFVSNAQFSESFEAATIPVGWSVINQGDTSTWVPIDLSTSTEITGHSGTYVVGIVYDEFTAHDDYLVTPAITVAAGVNDRFSFWARSRDAGFPEQIDLLLSTTTANAAAFTTTLQSGIDPTSGASFFKYTYDLSDYLGQTVYIAFHSTTVNQFIFDIDDVVSDALPFCSEPNPTVANITETSADFSWTAVPGSVNYEYVLDTNSADPVGAGTSTTALSYTASSLDSNTTYYFHIRNNCDTAGLSAWSTVSALTLPVFNGCLDAPNFGLYPTATFTPTCDGVADDVVDDGYAGEYSNVNVISGTEYTFTSSNPSDYITISDDDGATAAAYSLTPLVWTAATTGVIRFYTHADATCGEEASNRTRSVNCGTFVPLANDNLADASPIACGNTYTGSTVTASLDEDNAPDGFGADMDAPNVWYSYTGSGVAQTVTLNLCPSAYDTSVLVYTGTSGNLAIVAANDDDATCGAGFTTRSRVSFNSDGTSTYLIAIEGWDPDSRGAYSMEVTCTNSNPPAVSNQACASSLSVAVNATDVNSDNSYGDVSPVQTSCDLFGSIQDVWFSFVAPASGTVDCLLTPGTMTSANFTVYGGDCLALVAVTDACNSNLIAPTTESLTGLTVGNTYYVQVWSNAAEQGTFSLRLTNPLLAANQFDTSDFEAFPNPVDHILNLVYNSPITNVSIFNLLGQKVLMESSNSNLSQIDMSHLASGTYMVKITANNEVKTIKVVKQ